MEPGIEAISLSMNRFVGSVDRALQAYPPDRRRDLLAKLVNHLGACVMLHVELMNAERDGRFLITEPDYHRLLEDYLAVFRQIRKMPRAGPKSTYEISLISSIDTILKSHCDGENVE